MLFVKADALSISGSLKLYLFLAVSESSMEEDDKKRKFGMIFIIVLLRAYCGLMCLIINLTS